MHARHLDDSAGFSIIEAVVTVAIFAIIVASAATWVISAGRTVAASTNQSSNNAAAQAAIDQLDANIRFASDLYIYEPPGTPASSTTSGFVLYVQNGVPGQVGGPPSTCTEWFSPTSSGSLEKAVQLNGSSTYTTSVVATGISGLSFTGNSSYSGLISVSFKLNQYSTSSDPNGVTINETLAASNMSGGVGSGSCGSGFLPPL